MPFSAGVYSLPTPALVPGQTVASTENNTSRNDFATALNLTMLRNGTSTATANLPMGGYKLTGLGVATTLGDALSYNQAAVVSNLTDTALTITRVPYVSTGGLLIDSANFTFDGTTLTATGFAGPLTGNVTGNVSGNAGTVTNGVYTTGDQTIGGTKTFSSNPILSGGTANGVAYLNGSKVLTSGSALTFNGTTLQSPQIYQIQSLPSAYNTQVLENSASNGYTQFLFSVGSGGANGQASISYAPGVFFAIGPTSNDTTTPIVFRTNNATEQMRLTSTGLGIGTSSPSCKLQVNGAIGETFKISGGTTNTQYQTFNTSGGNYYIGVNSSAGTGLLSGSGYDFCIVTESARPILFGTNNTKQMTLDSSGNLGLGVTPSAWSTNYKAFQIGTGFIANTDPLGFISILQNAYYSASGYKYGGTNPATNYYQQFGQHIWQTAPSGTAGSAISFTQAMTLDASGNLGVGTASPAQRLHVYKSSYPILYIADATYSSDLGIDSGSGNFVLGNNSAAATIIKTGGTERMRIDSSGNVGIGTSSPTRRLQVYQTSGDYQARVGYSDSYYYDFGRNSSTGYFNFYGNQSGAIGYIWSGADGERMRIDSSGQLKTQVTNGFAVIDTYGCRAWVNFDGTAAGTFAGGTSLITRNVGTTTCTVTTTTAHGLITGNVVYNNAITGLVAGARTVTVTNSTTFTFTSTETTSIAAATITFAFANIRAAGNVNSVADIGVGNYYINFTTAMPDAYYSVSGSAQGAAGTSISLAAAATSATPLTANSFPIEVNTDAGAALDSATVSVQVFR